MISGDRCGRVRGISAMAQTDRIDAFDQADVEQRGNLRVKQVTETAGTIKQIVKRSFAIDQEQDRAQFGRNIRCPGAHLGGAGFGALQNAVAMQNPSRHGFRLQSHLPHVRWSGRRSPDMQHQESVLRAHLLKWSRQRRPLRGENWLQGS